jgi:4-amino-4-deoxy-L-arabinose transferase-like glycosyltransferase
LSATAILLLLALAKLLLHLAAIRGYGLFDDEMYFLACGRRLACGYVDQPPLIAVVARIVTALLGDSVFAIRLLPAIAGGTLVFLTGLMAQGMGGGRFARVLAALGVIVVPTWLFFHHVFTMNAFEPLFWMGCACLTIQIVLTRNSKLWLWCGVLAGVGLLNKHSMFLFGFGLLVGLLLTRERVFLRERWIWLGVLLAFLIFLPNLVWQMQHGWPQLEILRAVRASRDVRMTAPEFLLSQVGMMNPATLPIWLGGLYFFFSRSGKSYRALGWAYLLMLATFVLLHGKIYYLLPAYPMLLAAGGVQMERVIQQRGWNWLKPGIVIFVVAAGIALAPMALPLLPVKTYLRYTRALGIDEIKTEVYERGRLPQHYAAMFGWENMVASVADVYHGLPAEEKRKAAIFAPKYGEAGAIDYFGPRFGLPKAISGSNNYFLWGPQNYTGEVVIMLGGRREDHLKMFEQVRQAATVVHEYALPVESNLPVWVCRKPKLSLQELWPRMKRYD